MPFFALIFERKAGQGRKAGFSYLYGKPERMPRELPDGFELQLAAHSEDPLCCGPELTLQEAARQMQQRSAGSILICRDGRPEGILTDKDLRRAAAGGANAVSTPVRQFMSAPVITAHAGIHTAQALASMLRHNISHLVITENGSPDSRAVGVVSQRDLLVTRGRSPAGIMQEIREADALPHLVEARKKATGLGREYLEQGLPVTHAAGILTALHDALTFRIIDWASEQAALPEGVSFAWLALGSQGRGEQLIPTDQDNALIFADVPEPEKEKVRAGFVRLATQVNAGLEELGFARCPAGMMAGNPQWCLSASEWQALFGRWIDTPDPSGLLHSTIFFDFRSLYGPPQLEQVLAASIREHLLPKPVFLNYLGVDAFKTPKPLGMLGRFRRERAGEHKGLFDLKARMLMPLADIARLLILPSGLDDPKNTAERFTALAASEPRNAELFRTAAVAYAFLSGLRVRAAWGQNGSGRYLELASLSRWERSELRRCVRVTRELQQLILVRFQLAQLL